MYRLYFYFLEVFMRVLDTRELREREVINVCTGEKLGFISDLVLDADCGQILSVKIPRGSGGFNLFKREQYIIPWCRIECIGEDTVLVKLSERELCDFLSTKGKRKRC